MKAFHEESFSHHGKHYDLPPRVPYRGYTLEKTDAGAAARALPVECWQPIQGAQRPRARLHGEARHQGHDRRRRGRGRRHGRRHRGLSRRRRAAPARDRARRGPQRRLPLPHRRQRGAGLREAAPYFEENVKMFGPLRLARGLSEEQIRDISDPSRAPHAGLPTIEDAAKAGAFLAGPPEVIVEKLMSSASATGPASRDDEPAHGAPQSGILEQLERLAAGRHAGVQGARARPSPDVRRTSSRPAGALGAWRACRANREQAERLREGDSAPRLLRRGGIRLSRGSAPRRTSPRSTCCARS